MEPRLDWSSDPPPCYLSSGYLDVPKDLFQIQIRLLFSSIAGTSLTRIYDGKNFMEIVIVTTVANNWHMRLEQFKERRCTRFFCSRLKLKATISGRFLFFHLFCLLYWRHLRAVQYPSTHPTFGISWYFCHFGDISMGSNVPKKSCSSPGKVQENWLIT